MTPKHKFIMIILLFFAWMNVFISKPSVAQIKDLTPNTWMKLVPSQITFPSGFNGSFESRAWCRFVYRDTSHSILFYEGYVKSPSYPSAIYANCMYSFSLSSQSLSGLEIRETNPTKRHTYKGFCYAPLTDAVYILCGANQTSRPGLNDTYKFSFSTNTWTKVADAFLYGDQYEGHLNWVPQYPEYLYFMVNDAVYKFNLVTEKWSTVATNLGNIFNFYEGSSTVDTKRGLIVFYYGYWDDKLVAFDPATETFEVLENDPSAPYGSIVYNSLYDVYIIIGQMGNPNNPQMYVYDPLNRTLRNHTTEGKVRAERNVAYIGYLTYDEFNDVIVASFGWTADGSVDVIKYSTPSGPPSPPIITSVPDTVIKAGENYQYQVIAIDPDNDDLTYSLEIKPIWMNIDPNTGLISGVPSNMDVGQTTVKIMVDDGNNGLAFQSYRLTVEATSNIVISEIRLPENIVLFNNYPNPFNPITQIKFGLPNSSFIRLDIYNVHGKKVINLCNDKRNAGYHTIEFNANNLPSGIYFYRLETESYIGIKQMVLIR